MQILLTRANFY